MYTMIVSIVLPNGTDPRPAATVCWPSGEIQRITLTDHDWSADTWDWRNGHLPDSFRRWLYDQFFGTPKIHGSRAAYVSPADVGTDSNEAGRLMVYEIDYEG